MKCSGEVHLCLTLRGDEPCPAAGEGIKRLPRGVYPFDFAQGRPERARFLAPTSRGSDLSLVFILSRGVSILLRLKIQNHHVLVIGLSMRGIKFLLSFV